MKTSLQPRYLAICAFFAALSSAAYGDTAWCQVELIVFAQQGRSSEVFAAGAGSIAWPSDLVELSEPAMPLAELQQLPLPFVPLQNADLGMNAAYQTLGMQSAYRPLLHIAWLQPLDAAAVQPAVHIRGGAEGVGIDGFVRVLQQGTPQLQADLEYRETAAPGGESNVYRLHEQRGMPLGSVQYFDHPKFGLIAQLSPLQ